jgi:DNA-binding XRE family transcriptional regulator
MPRNDRLRAARKAKGWTQTELGELIGGSPQSTIARLELGVYEPSLRTALALGRTLDLSVEALFECVPPDQRSSRTEDKSAGSLTTHGEAHEQHRRS